MAAVAGVAILQALGATEAIGNIVKNFDFSKMNMKDSTKEDYLHTELAPSFGKLNNESLQAIDDELKIMMAGTMKVLAKEPNKSWNSILSAMRQNQFVEQDGAEINRADKIIKESVNAFKFDGSPDANIVKEVKTWFTKLVSDQDILECTKIDIEILANIVAQTGAAIDSFETFFSKRERHEKTMIDVGVLRFPDIDHPHFKLYRIKLSAWSDSTRIIFHQEDKNGITGEFNCRTFKPRMSVISSMTDQARKKAIDSANDLFA